MSGVFSQIWWSAVLMWLAWAGQTAHAQAAPDRFKTEIFLTPYSQLGEDRQAYPGFYGQMLGLVGYTGYFGVHDDNGQIPTAHWSSTQPQIEGAFVLQWTQRLSVRAKLALDSATQETRDNGFSDLGMSLSNLFVAYTADRYALYGGKMDLGFGDAWHVIDGLYSGFTEGTEYRGAIGLGGRYVLDAGAAGAHSFAAVLFKQDDSSLGKRLSFEDGVVDVPGSPAFSDDLKSFVVSYDFRNLPGLTGISGGADVGRLHADPGAESAAVASFRLRYDTPLGSRWHLGWYNEATYSSAFLGTPVDSLSGVTSASFSLDRWQWTLTAAARSLAGSAATLAQYGFRDDPDWALSGAVTYVTPIGLIAQAGLTRERDQSLVINQGVFRVAYQVEF